MSTDEEQVEGTESGLSALAEQVAQDPSDSAAWEQLEEIAADSGDPDEVSAIYRRVLEGDLPDGVASSLAKRAAGFHEEWYSESSPVLVEVLSRALEVDPRASEWAFQRLTVVHTVAERWDELMALYDLEIERTPDTHRRASLLEEAAQTAKDFASDPNRAATYMLALYELRPSDRSLASSLERLLERQDRYEDLVTLWRSQAKSSSDLEYIQQLRLRIAEALFVRLEKPDDALAELQGLLETEGVDADGPTEMLERIVRDDNVPAESRRKAVAILRSTYDALGRSADLISALDTAMEFEDAEGRARLHRDAARRLEQAGEIDAAVGHLGSLLELVPDDEAALSTLRQLTSESRQERLVEILIQAAGASDDTATVTRHRSEAARLLEARGQYNEAIDQLTAVLTQDNLDDASKRSTLRWSATLFEQAERSEEQLIALENLALVEEDRGATREALVAAARLARRLGVPDRAIKNWEAVLDAEPNDQWALEEIIHILGAEERNAELATVLRRRADSGVPQFQRKLDLQRIAEVQSAENVDGAIQTWIQVGEEFGEDQAVIDNLVELYARSEQWRARAEVLERAAARDEDHVAALRAAQGDTFAGALGDEAGAVRAYGRALLADPRHEAARAGLRRLAEESSVRGQAVEALARSYEETDEWEAELDLLDLRLDSTSDTGLRLEILGRAKDQLESRRGDPTQALLVAGRAFALAPERNSLEQEVSRLAGLAGNASAHAQALHGASLSSTDAFRRAELAYRQAQLLEELEDFDGAFDALLRALRDQPGSADISEHLARLGRQVERTGETEEALLNAAKTDRRAHTFELLEALQQETESEGRRASLEALVQLRPEDLDALTTLSELASDDEKRGVIESIFDRASSLWRTEQKASGEVAAGDASKKAAEWLVENEADPSTRARFEQRVSRLPLSAEESLSWIRRAATSALEAGDELLAMSLLREVLERDADDAGALSSLGSIYESHGRKAELLELRRRELAVTEDMARKVALRLEVANLVTEIDERGGRLESLKANLSDIPGHEASLEALSNFLVARRNYDELANVLEAQGEAVEGEAAAPIWKRAAEINETQLNDVERAINAHKRVVEIYPEDTASLDALSRMFIAREEHAQASRWLERRLAVDEGPQRSDIALTLANTLLSAGRTQRACEVLEEARQENTSREDLRTLLAAQYRQAGEHRALAEVLADSAQHASEKEAVLGYVREAATLYREKLGAPAAAIPVLRKARELAPEEREIELLLADGLRDAEEYDEAREMLEKVVSDFGRRRSADRANVHYDLARVLHAQGDVAAAIEQLELASKMAAAKPRVLQLLGRLARESDDLERAEKAYRALLMTVRRTPDDTDVSSAEVLYELHALAKLREETEQAEELRESALEAAAQSDADARAFREALEKREEHDLIVAALDRRVEIAHEASSKAANLGLMAEVLEEVGRREEANWRRLVALEHDPSNDQIHDQVLASLREAGDVSDYASKLDELLTSDEFSLSTEDQAKVLVRLGTVREIDDGDLDAATSLYGRAESLMETPIEAWVALARLGYARGDIPLQRRVLTELIELSELDEDTLANALYQLAHIQLRDTDGLEDALPTARRAFDLQPRHADLVADFDVALKRYPGHVDATRLFEEIARDATDDTLLLIFLERRAASDSVTLPQVREAVEKARALGEDARLDALLERAAEVAENSDPEEGRSIARGIFRELAERRTEQGDVDGALNFAERAVETAEFEDERRELELVLAKAAMANGARLDKAAEVLERLRETEPQNPELWRPLLMVYSELPDEDRLNDLVAYLLEALLDPAERNEARMTRAKFFLRSEEREFDAVDTLKDVLLDEPEHAEATQLLTALYEKSGYSEDLVDLLRQQLDAARDSGDLEQIGELSVKLGELLDKVERQDAMDVYRRALDWVPQHRGIIERYLVLLDPSEDPREYVLTRERLLGVEEGAAASQLAREVYQEWANLEDEEGMLRALSLGFKGNPGDDGIRTQLEDFYRQSESHQELVDFLVLDAERVASDTEAAVARILEAAHLKRDTLSDATGAVELLQNAHERFGGPAILGELVVTLQSAGRSDEAETTISGAIENYGTEDVGFVELLVSRARIRRALGAQDDARADLERGYAISAPHAAAELVDLLVDVRDSAAQAGDGPSQREAVFRLTDVLLEASETEQARDVLAHWTTVDRSDIEALRRLRDIELSWENWVGVLQAVHQLVQLEEGAEQIASANLLAEAATNAGAPEQAQAGLEFVHQAQPTEASIFERLRTLYEAQGDSGKLAGLMLEEAEATEDADAAFELEREAGRLYIEVGQGEAALEALRRARNRKPDDHATTVFLADAYIAAGHLDKAGSLLEDAISRHTRRRSPELSQLQFRMAKLAASSDDTALERQWLQAALESDKGNGEVAARLAQKAWADGDMDAAMNALRAITLSKSDGPMSRAQAFLMMARIAHQKNEQRRAVLWARQARTEDPNLEGVDQFLAQLGES